MSLRYTVPLLGVPAYATSTLPAFLRFCPFFNSSDMYYFVLPRQLDLPPTIRELVYRLLAVHMKHLDSIQNLLQIQLDRRAVGEGYNSAQLGKHELPKIQYHEMYKELCRWCFNCGGVYYGEE